MWKTNNIYVCKETGEILEEKQIKEKDYIVTKKVKVYAKFNATTGKGTVEYRNECKKNEQGKLF